MVVLLTILDTATFEHRHPVIHPVPFAQQDGVSAGSLRSAVFILTSSPVEFDGNQKKISPLWFRRCQLQD